MISWPSTYRTWLLFIQNDTDERVSGISVPSDEFYNGLVTWSGLEDALNGLRDSLSTEQTTSVPVVVERTVIDTGNQTDPVSRQTDTSDSQLLTTCGLV